MKVWVVVIHHVRSSTLLGVFDTEDLANERLDEYKATRTSWNDFTVTEVGINEPVYLGID